MSESLSSANNIVNTPNNNNNNNTPNNNALSSPVPYDNLSSPVNYGAVSSPRSGTSQVARTPLSYNGIRTPLNNTSGTPILPRGEMSGLRPVMIQQPNTSSTNDARPSSTSNISAGNITRVWGTSIGVDECMEKFKQFFEEFKENDDDDNEALYPRLLDEIIKAEIFNINVDCHNLYKFDDKLYYQLINYPTEIIPIMDLTIHQIIEEKYPDIERTQRTQVRTFNLKKIQNMRELDPIDIDKMISIKGMVIRTSKIIPDLRSAFFQCSNCKNTIEVPLDRGRIDEPRRCSNCNQDHTLQMVHNRSLFADRQLIKIQETPDSIPEGETPHTVTVFAYDDLVDIAKPGDRVTVTGIYKARSLRNNPKRRVLNSVYSTFVDVIHFQKQQKGKFSVESSLVNQDSEFYTSFEESDTLYVQTEEKERQLRELSNDPNIKKRLIASLAPSIWEMDDVKLGILCQLFGGSNKSVNGNNKFRGELNILLCGDPGTSKSQLLNYVHKIAPRGIYTSGKGSSAVGLTAYIAKDPDTKEMVLESGALVLSDRGICCIDEFDKMSDSARAILHEVMEQQTVSIAKAGIVATLNARTSILASANPINSRYDPSKSVVGNIDLPPTLLSRFDLIYLILDQPNERNDRKLASHLVSLYFNDDERVDTNTIDLIPTDILTSYISYARANCNPRLTDECIDELINDYVEMRKIGYNSHRKVITATPRQLESLIRISEALARMRLSDRVEKRDVQEAKHLMEVATQRSATDPSTGMIDMDLIATGQSSMQRQQEQEQLKTLRELLNRPDMRKGIKINALLNKFNEQSNDIVNQRRITNLLDILVQENQVKFLSRDKVKAV